MLTRRRPATNGTIQVTAEHDIGHGLLLQIPVNVNYTIGASTPADHQGPEEAGEVEYFANVTDVLCEWNSRNNIHVARIPIASHAEREAWGKVAGDELDLEQLCRDDAANHERENDG